MLLFGAANTNPNSDFGCVIDFRVINAWLDPALGAGAEWRAREETAKKIELREEETDECH